VTWGTADSLFFVGALTSELLLPTSGLRVIISTEIFPRRFAMASKKAVLIGLCPLLLLGCQVLNKLGVPDDWSMVRIPVGLNAWLPCIPVEQQSDDKKGSADRNFACGAGSVRVKAWYYGSGQTYNLEKGAAAFEGAIRKATKRDGGELVHHQSRLTVSGLPAVRMKSSFVFPKEKSTVDGVLISDGKDGWLINVIYPSRLASGMEPQLTKLFETLEVHGPRSGSTNPSP
jgi:hypothetical protein